jgi:hypothetical protein
MTRIVTTTYRYKRPLRKRKAVALEVKWSGEFGQGVKLGLLLRRTDLNDRQAEAVFGGFQGEGCS